MANQDEGTSTLMDCQLCKSESTWSSVTLLCGLCTAVKAAYLCSQLLLNYAFNAVVCAGLPPWPPTLASLLHLLFPHRFIFILVQSYFVSHTTP